MSDYRCNICGSTDPSLPCPGEPDAAGERPQVGAGELSDLHAKWKEERVEWGLAVYREMRRAAELERRALAAEAALAGARREALEEAVRACLGYIAEVKASRGTPSIKSARTWAAEQCAEAIRRALAGSAGTETDNT
ncbi:MAG TPA: hypothetical protein VIU39_08705 [Anaerolineales bacterium]